MYSYTIISHSRFRENNSTKRYLWTIEGRLRGNNSKWKTFHKASEETVGICAAARRLLLTAHPVGNTLCKCIDTITWF